MSGLPHESDAPTATITSRMAAGTSPLTTVAHVSVLSAGWLLLTDANPSSWVIGVPAVAAAAWAIRRTTGNDTASISIVGVAWLVPYFLWQSARGGLDVALRTLMPRMRIRPGYVTVPTRLTQARSRIFMTYCVNLLPGTLTADLDGDRLHIHLLDAGADPDADLRRLEHYVARVFRDDLQASAADRVSPT